LKRKVFILIQLLISLAVFGQRNKKIDFDLDSFAFKDSIDKNLSFEQTVNRINHYCSTDTQKLCLMAGWVYNNINFDLKKFYRGGGANNYKVVFQSKKGICGDYSNIFSAFCDKLNIENEIIEGYAPEYDSDNKVYYETNHAWNIVKIGNQWYHCDLLGFSGYLKKDSVNGFRFVKQPNKKNFLTQEISFLAKHIPADPMWQLSNYPIPLNTLLKNGKYSKNDSTKAPIDYKAEIEKYIKLSKQKKLLTFADNAYKYNKNNCNVIVVNYYNAAVDLVNHWNNDKGKLIQANLYLIRAKTFAPQAKNGVEVLNEKINNALETINKYESKSSKLHQRK
jgi:Transglutaminase-like superfamily